MKGRLFDLYPGNPGEMVVWLKQDDGQTVRLVDHWSPSFFISTDDASDLRIPLQIISKDLEWTRPVQKFEHVTDHAKTCVMEAKVKDAKKIQQVAGRMERMGPFGAFRLYNVDISPGQSYLYERGLFPLAFCEVTQTSGKLQWDLHDDMMSCEYEINGLRVMKLDVSVRKEGMVAKLTDRLQEIRVEAGGEEFAIEGQSEADQLLELSTEVRRADPDFILTNDGDTFVLPYLAKRAQVSRIAGVFIDREGIPLRAPSKEGTSYFSYGQIHFKPTAMKLFGRIHIDINSSFAFSEGSFDGLFELSRICRMPMHMSSRSSIGKALSSLQFYNAWRRDILVPWKPTLSELFKNRNELMAADRGGMIFEPQVGVHEGVGELDFSALFPNIMLEKNISAETVKCACCPDSANRVPGLNWNVCNSQGLIPRAMEVIVTKRLRYKELRTKFEGKDKEELYEARQGVLKWIGVTSFGYLGFNNAKFGRIDAHIAVCAWDRKILMDAARVAETEGFEVVHGIVDSLWIKKPGSTRADFMRVKAMIEEKTGFPMNFEGAYRWVAFLPSKVSATIPVQNRYFGVYDTGKVKVRGIEARRHDTPAAFRGCQTEILELLARAESLAEARGLLGQCMEIFLKFASSIECQSIPAEDLAFTTNLSKAPDEYSTSTVQRSAIQQLVREGVKLHAGEGIRYVITDYEADDSRKATPLDFIRDRTKYDSKRYIELLAETCASVLEPFDSRYTAEGLTAAYRKTLAVPLT